SSRAQDSRSQSHTTAASRKSAAAQRGQCCIYSSGTTQRSNSRAGRSCPKCHHGSCGSACSCKAARCACRRTAKTAQQYACANGYLFQFFFVILWNLKFLMCQVLKFRFVLNLLKRFRKLIEVFQNRQLQCTEAVHFTVGFVAFLFKPLQIPIVSFLRGFLSVICLFHFDRPMHAGAYAGCACNSGQSSKNQR